MAGFNDAAVQRCCKSRPSRRMIIAHRFIGGSEAVVARQSVKRTAEIKASRKLHLSSRPLHGLSIKIQHRPALKRWAILIQSASRTQENYFYSKAPLCSVVLSWLRT